MSAERLIQVYSKQLEDAKRTLDKAEYYAPRAEEAMEAARTDLEMWNAVREEYREKVEDLTETLVALGVPEEDLW